MRRGCLLALAVVAAAWAPVARGQGGEDFWQRATVYRDAWGVPHVEAADLRAMAFAFGYAQAEDHAEAMLVAYRVANGRAAAVLGEPYAASDECALKMGHARLAAQAWEGLDPVTRDLCEGFAMGVNAWLVEHPGDAPAWAEGVQPRDILALWHSFLMSFADLDLPGAYDPPPAMPTANAWALAPGRTDTGESLLVINPHQQHDGPYRWYEAHLSVGDLNVAGATLFGLPVIVMGHNAVLGWAMTPNAVDFADVFEEQLNLPGQPAGALITRGIDPKRVLLLHYYASAESYLVRTPTGLEERFTPCLSGPRGPLLEHGGSLYSWRIGGYGQFGGLRQLVDMARAGNLDGFQQALLQHQIPCFNVLYADRAGHLFLTYNAIVGVKPPSRAIESENPLERRGPVDWKSPLPAAFDLNAWNRIVPPGNLPHLLNPASGYLQACGAPPWLATADSGLDPGAWPFWLIGDADSPRARRVRQLLRAGVRSTRDMEAMLYDASCPAAALLAPRLVEAVGARSGILGGAHPDLAPALSLLGDWNHVASTDAEAMTFYHAWWTRLRERTTPALPTDAACLGALDGGDPKAWDDAVMAADDAVRRLANEQGSVHVPWGRAHRILRGGRDEPMPGAVSGDPIFRAGAGVYRNGQWVSDYGYGFAMVVSLGNTPSAVSMVPFGASEDPASPHFDDQLDLMLEKRFKRTRFDPDEVKRYAAEALGRRVRLYPLGVQGVATVEALGPVSVRLDSAPDPPAPLPAGLRGFTAFVSARWEPAATDIRVRYDFAVPPELCLPDNLPLLRFLGWTPAGEWVEIDPQRLDPATGVFTAVAPGGLTVAVAGPESVLTVPPEPESPAEMPANATDREGVPRPAPGDSTETGATPPVAED